MHSPNPHKKRDFPAAKIRKFLEPGPVVFVSSHWKGKNNIMTMGWHTVREFTPSLIGCIMASSNHSFEMIRKSKGCVINISEASLQKTIIGIGNCSGDAVDKFEKFKLTAKEAAEVKAPLIKECYANFECRLHDARTINSYNFFVFKVLKAHVAVSPKFPETVHYRGEGLFTLSGKTADLHRQFTNPANL